MRHILSVAQADFVNGLPMGLHARVSHGRHQFLRRTEAAPRYRQGFDEKGGSLYF